MDKGNGTDRITAGRRADNSRREVYFVSESLFWSKRGDVACSSHAPEFHSARWGQRVGVPFPKRPEGGTVSLISVLFVLQMADRIVTFALWTAARTTWPDRPNHHRIACFSFRVSCCREYLRVVGGLGTIPQQDASFDEPPFLRCTEFFNHHIETGLPLVSGPSERHSILSNVEMSADFQIRRKALEAFTAILRPARR
jgi:hypothetical protein